VLVADDQFIQQANVLAFEPGGYGEVLLPRLLVNCGEGTRYGKRSSERGCTHLIQLDARFPAKASEKWDADRQ
jgi:hypothetical protein